MHFLRMGFRNSRHAGSGELRISRCGDRIAKRTMLEGRPRGLEALRLIAATCGGTQVIARLGRESRKLCGGQGSELQIEVVLALFPPYEASRREQRRTTIGVRLNDRGEIAARYENGTCSEMTGVVPDCGPDDRN